MTEHLPTLCESLARLLRYPDNGYLLWAEAIRETLQAEMPGASTAYEAFFQEITAAGVTDLEELFTRTFDLNPVSSLDVGWHLYGEEYERGAFLVKMRQELRRLGIGESTELPDHLSYCLEVVERLNEEEAGVFSENYLLPALKKMLTGFEGKSNPYEKLLQTIETLLAARYVKGALEVQA